MTHTLALYRFIVFMIVMMSASVAFSEGPQGVAPQSNISASADCTEININYTLDRELTRQEAIAMMDEAFYESLNKFDACQVSQSGVTGGAAASSASTGEESLAGSGSVASPNISGTNVAESTDTIAAVSAKGDNAAEDIPDRVQDKKLQRAASSSNGKVPDDIPSAENDSILEAQIRQAAMNEADAETREKLWDEYRKYKKSSRSRR